MHIMPAGERRGRIYEAPADKVFFPGLFRGIKSCVLISPARFGTHLARLVVVGKEFWIGGGGRRHLKTNIFLKTLISGNTLRGNSPGCPWSRPRWRPIAFQSPARSEAELCLKGNVENSNFCEVGACVTHPFSRSRTRENSPMLVGQPSRNEPSGRFLV